MPNQEKKIFCSFRLSAEVLGELEALANATKMDKTEIVEVAIMVVRPVIQRKIKARLEAIESLPSADKTAIKKAASQSYRAVRLAQESGKKQTTESPSGNKSSQEAAG